VDRSYRSLTKKSWFRV